ncbi:AsmA family protein [Sphingomonas solaris]|uniref:AsmA family protein n=1 Tax=Alterirhizorhabdus solaris TaxID=2529389 RepID=UPI001396A692|nr:AsmA family protein [Sphingomonas solaris]
MPEAEAAGGATTAAARSRRLRRIALWVAAGIALLLLLLSAFPWGLLAGRADGMLSTALGRPVSIGSARRTGWLSFVPEIELHDVRIAQPGWAGTGDMARAGVIRLRLPVLPLLIGQVRPRSIAVEGLTLHLVRDGNGRDNWSGGKKGGDEGDGPGLADLTIRDARLRLDDAKRHVALQASLSSDRAGGVRIAGAGTLRDQPLRLSITAPALATADPAASWPARVSVRSPLVSMDGTVRMDRPLDTGHFTATLTAHGRDLRYLDDIVQAGLFPTQDFRLAGTVRHDGQAWRVPRVDVTIGRSSLRAAVAVSKEGERTKLNGQVHARTLDFDDFASDEQKAEAKARERRIGARVVPATRIVLDKLGTLDGRLVLRADRLLSATPSPFRSLNATVTLDRQRLRATPLTVGLPHGRVTGTLAVDGQGRTPRLSFDLRVAEALVSDFFPTQQVVAGPLRAHLRLAGSGDTVRDAMAHGDGTLAFVVPGGSVRRDYATFLGGDVIKSIGAAADGKTKRTNLDCLIATFKTRRGRMTPEPVLLSTPVARGDGAGVIVLGPETIDMRVSGHPTRPGLLVSTAPVRLFGTLSQPRIDIRPPRAKSQEDNDILSRVGLFIKKLRVRGDEGARAATPVKCPAEIRRALG